MTPRRASWISTFLPSSSTNCSTAKAPTAPPASLMPPPISVAAMSYPSRLPKRSMKSAGSSWRRKPVKTCTASHLLCNAPNKTKQQNRQMLILLLCVLKLYRPRKLLPRSKSSHLTNIPSKPFFLFLIVTIFT